MANKAWPGDERGEVGAGSEALRFARVLRYRDDKVAAEADTLADVRAVRAFHG